MRKSKKLIGKAGSKLCNYNAINMLDIPKLYAVLETMTGEQLNEIVNGTSIYTQWQDLIEVKS